MMVRSAVQVCSWSGISSIGGFSCIVCDLLILTGLLCCGLAASISYNFGLVLGALVLVPGVSASLSSLGSFMSLLELFQKSFVDCGHQPVFVLVYGESVLQGSVTFYLGGIVADPRFRDCPGAVQVPWY